MKISAPIALALMSRWMNWMLRAQLEPYAGAHKIWHISSRALADSPETMHALWTIWGAFAEPLRFEEEGAEQMILRAAREWLALPQDDTLATAAYLERWIHEELGYGRARLGKAAAVNQSRQTYQRRAKVTSPLTSRLPKNGHDAERAKDLVADRKSVV